MVLQVFGLQRKHPALQIVRCGDQIAHALAEPLRHDGRILKFAEANAEIDILGDQIEKQVGDEEIDLDIGIGLQEG